jgi:Zn-dependent M16 (insulinase) family peptidase
MDVYLDAVFHPNIYKKPEIFLQEGWHYELDDPAAELQYNGVVYNEMKGAFSSPEQILFRKIEQSLFPDTPYGVESGGDPAHIPELTYEQFLDFHRAYYHPANSFIYLYGNGDLERQLAFINDSYLADFHKITLDSAISSQPPFKDIKELEINYPVSADEDKKDKTFFALNYVGCQVDQVETVLGLTILNNILLQTSASPLKKALIEAGIGMDVSGVFDPEILQPVFSIVLKNSNPEHRDRFKKIIRQTLEEEIKNGLNKKLVAGAVNSMEFKLREADYHSFPKGLIYNLQCMTTWLYGFDPLEPLRYDRHLAAIREKMDNGYFEKLIKEFLLENRHGSLVTLTPQQGLAGKQEQELRAALAARKEKLTSEEVQKLISQTNSLHDYQQQPDSPEILDTIPLLSLADIDPQAEKLPCEKKSNEIDILLHPQFSNNIGYVNLYFDVGTISRDNIPYLGLLESVLGRMDTRNYDYPALVNEINVHLGGLSFAVDDFGKYKQPGIFYAKFKVAAKALSKKTDKMAQLLAEVILHTDFSDKKRLREIIRETRSGMEMDIMQSGHVYARTRAASYLSERGAFHELLNGISFYRFIRGLDEEFTDRAGEIVANLKQVAKDVFNRNQAILSITADKKECERITDKILPIVAKCPFLVNESRKERLAENNKNEGFIIPGQVQYVAKAADLHRDGFSYDNRLRLLQTIVSTDYLWNQVRVKGGAYGAGCSFIHDGTFFFTSYRDPNLSQTLETYDNTADYIANFSPTERELRKYIIGAIGRLDTPLTPAMKGERATADYIAQLSQEEIQQQRDDILHAAVKELNALALPIREAMARGYCCVIGSESQINGNQDVFELVETLL